MSRLDFTLQATATGSRARAARFQTLHNEVLTPLFMPVGTQATVKAQTSDDLATSGSQILLANTYHLLLRPGPEVFERLGGIHRFMSWDRSVLTDSGGYQIFSLPHSRAMTEEGAVFQSYIDGKPILLSPERSIATQKAIGSDIMMVLDHCVPSTADEATALAALEMTNRWAARSLAARGDSPASMFAIVQGALYPHLRQQSAAALTAMPFDGFAIGGLAVGEGKDEREDTCEIAAGLLPADKPRYLMGVGTPLDVLEAVHRGVDMFDCVIPTKLAKQGHLYTSRGIVQLRRSVYKFADEPVDPACACPICQRYSRAYLHHLTKTGEALGWQLMGQHNLWFYHQLMRDIRASILNDRFLDLYQERRQILDVDDLENPCAPPTRARVRKTSALVLGDHEVHTALQGHASIRHVTSGEIMHSHSPPMDEARALYVEQSQLAARLREPGPPLVIWDVGLGAAANAIAAIHAYEAEAAKGPVRDLHLVSFENDLSALRLALAHKARFPYLRHGAADTLLHRGAWRSRHYPGLSWTLVQGDFFEKLREAPTPELLFYDFYSSRTNTFAWTQAAFGAVRAACGPGAELITYSTSTAVRVALLGAGFWVARGQASSVKTETTVGLVPGFSMPPRYPLLGQDWLAKWRRSQAKVPHDVEDRVAFEAFVEGHPQFAAE